MHNNNKQAQHVALCWLILDGIMYNQVGAAPGASPKSALSCQSVPNRVLSMRQAAAHAAACVQPKPHDAIAHPEATHEANPLRQAVGECSA